jgi:phosphoglycerol transferase
MTVCGIITAIVLNLRHANLSQPLTYLGGDEFPIAMWVKQMQESGWVLYNPRLGMPFPPEILTYPMPDTFHLLILKLIGMAIKPFGMVMNVFYLATYLLAFATCFHALRRFSIGILAAMVAALLYAFLPFHLMRAESHMMLSAYYTVPLVLILAYRILEPGAKKSQEDGPASGKQRRRFRYEAVAAFVVCLIVGSTGGGYYPFFACVLLAVAGAGGMLRWGTLRPLVTAGILAGIITMTVAVNVAPTLLQGRGMEHRKVFVRTPREAEIYGLKIAQLLLPIAQHRFAPFAKLKERYDKAPLINENDTSALGLTGAVGFVFLIGWLGFRMFNRRREFLNPEDDATLDSTAIFNLAATLLATIGGFGSIIALLAFPEIRSYNRISVFIGFFCLLAVALVIDRLVGARIKGRLSKAGYYLFLAILLVMALLDQTRPAAAVEYKRERTRFKSDAQFIQQIEATLPRGAMVFQLPYVTFPESPKIYQMTAYDPLVGYLHSEHLRWSYGGAAGGTVDTWEKSVVVQPLPRMVQWLAFAGFSGIYLDRYGYADNGLDLQNKLTNLLHEEPWASRNKRLLFFDLRPYIATLKTHYPGSGWTLAQEQVLHLPGVSVEENSNAEESDGQQIWRWTSSPKVDLVLTNSLPHAVRARLDCRIFTGHPFMNGVQIKGDGADRSFQTNWLGITISEPMILPPGKSTIEITTDASRATPPHDPRTLFLRIDSLSIMPDL